jgi:hypothetical protein
MNSGENNADKIDILIGMVSGLTEGRTTEQNATIAPLQGQLMGALLPLDALQDLDIKSSMMSMFPTESRDDPWTLADMVLITIAIDTKPSAYGVELETEVSVLVSDMSIALEKSLLDSADIEYSSNDELTVFSFSRFAEGQAGNIGAEIGMLTSASVIILGIILWRQFRSVRDTSIVIFLTLLAIAATYGVSGFL